MGKNQNTWSHRTKIIFREIKIIFHPLGSLTGFPARAIFFFCWNSHLYVSVHPQLVIERFYGFLTYLQEIGLKGKKGKLNNYSSHFWPCALPLTALSGIYEYCIPVLYWKFLYLYGGLHTVGWHWWFHCSPPPVGGVWTNYWHQHLILRIEQYL